MKKAFLNTTPDNIAVINSVRLYKKFKKVSVYIPQNSLRR